MNMTRKSRFTLLICLVVLALFIIIGGLVWAVSSVSSEDAASTERSADTLEEPAPPVDYSTYDEQDLAIEATEIMTTWNPREDDTQTAAELRARHLMTDELANTLEEPERSPGGEDWRQAYETYATSEPQVELTDATDGSYTTVHARWRWIEGNGTNSWWPDERRAYHFTFTEENGELKIADYTYETIRR